MEIYNIAVETRELPSATEVRVDFDLRVKDGETVSHKELLEFMQTFPEWLKDRAPSLTD